MDTRSEAPSTSITLFLTNIRGVIETCTMYPSHIAIFRCDDNNDDNREQEGFLVAHFEGILGEIVAAKSVNRSCSVREYEAPDDRGQSWPVLAVMKETILDGGIDDPELLFSLCEAVIDGKFPPSTHPIPFGSWSEEASTEIIFDLRKP